MKKNNLDELLEILLDKEVDIGGRDDIAMALSDYPCQQALDVLIAIGRDPTEEVTITDTVGESIANIMIALGHIDWEVIDSLEPDVKSAAEAILNSYED